MTQGEIIAFNDGVRAVLDLATRTAESLKPQLAVRSTRIGFAIAALEGIAQEGRALLKGDGLAGATCDPSPSPAEPTIVAAE